MAHQAYILPLAWLNRSICDCERLTIHVESSLIYQCFGPRGFSMKAACETHNQRDNLFETLDHQSSIRSARSMARRKGLRRVGIDASC